VECGDDLGGVDEAADVIEFNIGLERYRSVCRCWVWCDDDPVGAV
jgi:hypothetical protein